MEETSKKIERPRIWLGIGTKLISLIGVLLLVSAISLSWYSTSLFVQDTTATIQLTNLDTAKGIATQVRELIENTTVKMRLVGYLLLQESVVPEIKNELTKNSWLKDPDFVALFVHRQLSATQAPAVAATLLATDQKTAEDPKGAKLLSALYTSKELSLEPIFRGASKIGVIKLTDDSPAIALTIPLLEGSAGSFSHIVTVVFRPNRIFQTINRSELLTSYIVDSSGRLLAHPDPLRVSRRDDFSSLGIVRELLNGKYNNGQTRYLDPETGEARLGAFQTIGFGGLGVIAEVAEAKAFEAAHEVRRRAIYFTLIILCLSFLIGYVFSGTITWPITQLVDAAHRISEGDFKIDLKPRGQDEVALLSRAFNEMATGLQERDRVKDAFNRFHSKEIAERMLSGDVKLGGEKRNATIFFSDVRGFTGMSEQMEPEAVVEMLNEYMTRMVSVIRAHKGVVDKYVGDAIMAIWGVPFEGPNDSLNAVRACIAMRQELESLNLLRISKGQPALKIGMGLNSGPVIAGNIGSNEKMEYTVIGDAVNLASRVESMTKEYGTDCLISKSVAESIQGRFVLETVESAKVKGKSSVIELFKVLGYVDESGKDVIVSTPYSSYEAEKSEKGERPHATQTRTIIPPPPPAHLLGKLQKSLSPNSTLTDDFSNSHITPSTGRRGRSGARVDVTLSMEPNIPMPPPFRAPEATAERTIQLTPWYLRSNDEVLGPFSGEEIEQGLKNGELSPLLQISPTQNGPWVIMTESIFRGNVPPAIAA